LARLEPERRKAAAKRLGKRKCEEIANESSNQRVDASKEDILAKARVKQLGKKEGASSVRQTDALPSSLRR